MLGTVRTFLAQKFSSLFVSQVSQTCKRRPRLPYVMNIRSKHTNVEIEVKDIEIPVPWGHISARHWNPPNSNISNKKPVICLHGWKDNCASFDRLIPLLIRDTPNTQYLAIDLPGHGFSSHYPPGMIYSVPDIWVLIHRILKHFGWKKISLMGHSLGAQISFLYAGTHVDIVERFVAIDALVPFVLKRSETIGMIPKLTYETLLFEEKIKNRKPPLHTYDEVVQKLLTTHTGKLDEESCKTLMSRGIIETPVGSGKYRFSHDIRVHYLPITGISSRQVSFISKNFKSDLLYIKAIDGANLIRPYIKSRLEGWLNYNNSGNRLVQFVEVEGTHHVHLMDPYTVLPYISKFLAKGEPEKRLFESEETENI